MITLRNFEIYLTDYADGKLSATETAELQAFLLSHPDLGLSLEDAEPVKFSPPKVTYRNKELLKQFAVPDKLPEAEAPRFIPDPDIRFNGKDKLYRKSPLIVFLQKYSAAAALLLLFIGIGFFYFHRRPQPSLTLSELSPVAMPKERPLNRQPQLSVSLQTPDLPWPEKLVFRKTRIIQKQRLTPRPEFRPELLALTLPPDTVVPVRLAEPSLACSAEIQLTEKAQEWKPSGDNIQTNNIFSSVFSAGKSLANKLRKEEYASR